MASETGYKRLEHWIEERQSWGKLSFSLDELRQSFRQDSDTALKQLLERLTGNEKIVSVFKGYYVIIPPQYSSKGILPPIMFIDGLMQFLERKYYVGLLNAAALNGASHQQPQEYFVVTEYPVMRPTNRKGIRINYISTKQLPPGILIEKKKTETGYISVSNPMLTAIDLINYEKKIGGLNRAAAVINELVEPIRPKVITEELIHYARITSLQRLGYILDVILNRNDLAEKINKQCKKAGKTFYLIPLKASGKKQKERINEKWKLMINTEIQIVE
ncbi:MAG: type IV toxin-antitoxin system AbiEi family antitoxin [Bacteroidota bacterium]